MARTKKKLTTGEAPKERRPTLKERTHQMVLYLEPPMYDRLRDMAHYERTKMHPLMLEALEMLFKSRRSSSRRSADAG
jgi:hypothetical protein